MDTSDCYKRMCQHPVIQEKWKAAEGDFVILPTWGVTCCCYDRFEGTVDGLIIDEHSEGVSFLPRQDQIQEWMCPGLRGLKELVQDFESFVTYWIDGFITMEQLWLAFYMKETHGLTWNTEINAWEGDQ